MPGTGGVTDLLSEMFTAAVFGRKETARLPVRTSSNQAEAIYLPTAAPGLGDSGVIIGREVYSGKGYVYDPFQLYGQQLPAPHWLVLGESGNGKSSLEKTYVLRQLRFKDRQVVVLDAQGEDGVGEWNLIARALGVTPIRLDPHQRGGAGIRLNPLDPAIALTGQLALLRTIIEVALGRQIDERSGYALKAAHATVRESALRAHVQPILRDVVEALRAPQPGAAEEMNVGLEDVRDWGLDVALVLDRLVDGDLAGMFDGPTTQGIDLDSPLIVFDLSTIDRNSIAMPILMAIVGVWLEHTWIRPDRRKRIFLVEEAWHIINSPSVAQLFQRLLKFGRRLGLSFVAVVHHLSDVVDGAAAKEAAAILKMASTRTIYMQKSDEARATGRVLGLPRWAVEIIPTLSPGIAVWDVNGDVQVVKHIVTEIERPLVYTDRAMTEASEASPMVSALLAGAAATAAITQPFGEWAPIAATVSATAAATASAAVSAVAPAKGREAARDRDRDRDRFSDIARHTVDDAEDGPGATTAVGPQPQPAHPAEASAGLFEDELTTDGAGTDHAAPRALLDYDVFDQDGDGQAGLSDREPGVGRVNDDEAARGDHDGAVDGESPGRALDDQAGADDTGEPRFPAKPPVAPAAFDRPVPVVTAAPVNIPPRLGNAADQADDPELTALAAAVFGPRASRPTHG